MKARVYLETSVISYLASRPSRDLITAAHQQITHDWWATQSARFELCISQLVVLEASSGDPDAKKRRVALLEDIAILEQSDDVGEIARQLMSRVPIPERAAADALHMAIAIANGVNYLLTWNCTHIANAVLRPKVEAVCRDLGYEPPVICTPEELMGE